MTKKTKPDSVETAKPKSCNLTEVEAVLAETRKDFARRELRKLLIQLEKLLKDAHPNWTWDLD